jgi:hypothetical protein
VLPTKGPTLLDRLGRVERAGDLRGDGTLLRIGFEVSRAGNALLAPPQEAFAPGIVAMPPVTLQAVTRTIGGRKHRRARCISRAHPRGGTGGHIFPALPVRERYARAVCRCSGSATAA